jgi:hypothetical protein
MQAVRRTLCILTFVLHTWAAAGPARAQETAETDAASPAAARLQDGTSGPAEAVARLGSDRLASDGAGAAADGLRSLRAEVERLRHENEALRTDLRSTDRLVGAGLLTAGMLLGALLRAAAARRPQPRIRF